MGKIEQIKQQECPPHEFSAVTYQEQEAVTTRHDFRDKLVTTLTHQRVKLFCIKCGEVKNGDIK